VYHSTLGLRILKKKKEATALGFAIYNVKRFRGGLVSKAHRLLYDSREWGSTANVVEGDADQVRWKAQPRHAERHVGHGHENG